ncbi:MAG: hypothetical protein K0R54_2540 [Clostridiaceae bacterium]|nr:hypothetical protein [Clostridium sp.]MDF2505576.1 hypothetical protein [Clostridium sp.]MDF2881983.1 hypothetical protein [Clostridiaceae bacterium]
MNLTATVAGYMGLGIMFIDLFLKIMAIYTMFMIAKAIKTYIKNNS